MHRKGGGKAPYPLPLRSSVAGLVPFLAGQLVGGLAEPFHGFQFFQIPGRRVIENQFPAVALLEQLPLLWLHPGKLLVDSLVPVVLRPHLSALSEDSDPALGLNDFSPQVIVAGVHICDFFMELLALRLLCLGLRPVVEAGNAGLDFLEQLVVGYDL